MPTPTTTEEAIEKEHSDWNERALERQDAKAVRRLERCAKDPEIRKRENTRKRDRYANDPEFRERESTRKRDRYANDPEIRERENTRKRDRYANDPEWRARENIRSREWKSEHTVDPEWRARESARGREGGSEHTVEHTVDPVKFRNMYSQSGRPLRIPAFMKDESFALIDNGKGDQELFSLPDLVPHHPSGWAARLFKGRFPDDVLWNGDRPPAFLLHATTMENYHLIKESGVLKHTLAVRNGKEAAYAGVFFGMGYDELVYDQTNDAIPFCRGHLE